MRHSCGVQFINRFGCDTHRRIKTESDIRSKNIIINRLGHTDNTYPFLTHFLGNGHSAVTADTDNVV